MVHPVQSVIESLYAAGRCPRLHVNALYEGVVCPDFIREQWRERLIIDLDPSYPLDLTFEDDNLSADLSFGGYVTRCTFPYSGIYVVADRSTGRGIVLDQNMPESVKRSRYGKGQDEDRPEPALRSVPAADDDSDDDSEPTPNPALADAVTQPGPAATRDDEKDPTDEGEVQKRRAAFRVIDGGN